MLSGDELYDDDVTSGPADDSRCWKCGGKGVYAFDEDEFGRVFFDECDKCDGEGTTG